MTHGWMGQVPLWRAPVVTSTQAFDEEHLYYTFVYRTHDIRCIPEMRSEIYVCARAIA